MLEKRPEGRINYLAFFCQSPSLIRCLGYDKVALTMGNEEIWQFLKWFDLFCEYIHILSLSHSLYQAKNLKTVARKPYGRG